ncbi:uncharacterized protein LOC135814569 isoform X3 [Sycon ciliatum]|uniref:uncharacterized protein LOC135814569 isoform X3 n=1 Tax=Sycon ciliatum TaxID=27933 RepID=UPI0031F6C3AB
MDLNWRRGVHSLLRRPGEDEDEVAHMAMYATHENRPDVDDSHGVSDGGDDKPDEGLAHGEPIHNSFFQLKIVNILPKPATPRTTPESTAAITETSSASEVAAGTVQNETVSAVDSREGEPSADAEEDNGVELGARVFRAMSKDKFYVGPWGITIGSSKGCALCLPELTLVQPEHAHIEWRSDNPSSASMLSPADGGRARLTLQDLSGGGRFWLSCQPGCSVILHGSDEGDEEQRSELLSEPVKLCWGAKFSVGRVQFQVIPLTPPELARKRLFAAVRNNDATVLSAVLDAAKEHSGLDGAGDPCLLLRQTSTELTRGLDLDITDQQPCPSFEEETSERLQRRMRSPFAIGTRRERWREFLQRHAQTRHERLYLRSRAFQTVGLLHVAVAQSNVDMVSLLLAEGAQHGARVEITDRNAHLLFQGAASHKMRQLLLNVPLLCSSAEVGDVDEVRRLLACNTPPNGIGLRNKNSLHFASMSGHAEVVKLLLHAGASVDTQGGSKQRTALHYAALSGCVEVAQCLLKAGAKEDTQDKLGFTALNLTDNSEMCNLLKNTQSPSLCIAAQGGDIAMARQLLEDDSLRSDEKQDLVNQRNEQRHAAIHLACVAGNIEFLQLLLQHRVDVNMPGGSGEWTPLMFASAAGKAATVEYLLSVGADRTICSSSSSTAQGLVEETLKNLQTEEKAYDKPTSGRSAATSSSQVGTSTSTALSAPLMTRQVSHPPQDEHRQWLTQRRAHLQATLEVLRSGPQQLQQALDQNDLEAARALLEGKAVTAQCVFDKPVKAPALYHACSKKGLEEFAALLLDHGASLTAAGEDDLMPAHVAAMQGHVETVRTLLDRGQSMDARESTGGNTLLHAAAMFSHSTVVRLLLDSGADRTCVNTEGKTPFAVAKCSTVMRQLAVGVQRVVVEARAGNVSAVRSLLETRDTVLLEGLFKLRGDETPDANPLHDAVRMNHLPVVEVLVDSVCNINATAGKRRETALHVASRKGFLDIARYLTDHGARVNVKNSSSRTPYEVADSNAMRKLLVQEQRAIKIQPAEDMSDGIPDDKRCRVCMDRPVNTLILPCGHQAFCSDCAGQLEVCALDRQPINEIVKIFC